MSEPILMMGNESDNLPEIPPEPTYDGIIDSEEDLFTRIANLETQVGKLTAAVNSFGSSLQYIVDQVSSVGQAVAKGGIGGLMSQFMGGGRNG